MMNPTTLDKAKESWDNRALKAASAAFVEKIYEEGFLAGYAQACFQLAALEQNAETKAAANELKELTCK